MVRASRVSSLASAAIIVISASAAHAIDLPIRKAGLWEMKVLNPDSSTPMTMQQCTDESTDKDMSTSFSPMSKQVCSKNETVKTPNGFANDSVCSFGSFSSTTHSDIGGDFNSAYTVKSTSHSQGGPMAGRDSTVTIEAKWLGACKADQKPGDIVMPGGFKMNIRDMDKLKAFLPK